jgi:hypothetical protein
MSCVKAVLLCPMFGNMTNPELLQGQSTSPRRLFFILRFQCRGQFQNKGSIYLPSANTRFQAFFMLITFQPLLFAWVSRASEKVPTWVFGSPLVGP